ncbi:PRA1 family protein-domain-containing protein [Hypoxylon trugodes]|uniref:PRA1 family protein-domain-containing protein n=1 Tax=Hypoxylon trugodes TaxID=326681 RepID=UPI00218DE207|nr:PRA1 family protein-domain-containing protein [Hypoxylon trugodes]KAI1383526.1 PRA1 family protein-domain-containing protein [Hypoxylon trugodes]
MARIQIPLDVLTSRLNISDRFEGFRNTSLSSRFANMRPVGEFLDFKRLSKPANFSEVQSRVNYNLGTFSSNYALVFVLLSIYALITNPLLLFDLVLLIGGMWLLGRLGGQDLTIGTFHATSSQLYTGLLVTCGLLFLIASPFSTVLWLIGGLDGRPRAPKFAPQWGRPSRRPRRGWGEEEDHDIWSTGRRVVEELLEDDESDTQGADLVTTSGNRRFASDPLRFTGIDLGGGAQPRNGHAYQNSDEDDDSTEDDSQATSDDSDQEDDPATRELDEALVQSALARMRRAQAKGKQDVKLNKQELAALERRRKRLQAEAEATKRRNGKQRKEKEQRYAVPLSHFGGPSGSNESLSRRALPSTDEQDRQLGPPMGRFPPPNASRTRPRSGTSSTSSTFRPQSTVRETSPFDYQYVNAPPNTRHASDPSGRPTSSRLSHPHDEDWTPPSSSSSHEARDPFQYQTAGPEAASEVPYGVIHRRPVPTAVRSSPRRAKSRDARAQQELEDETTSDDGGHGGRIGSRGEILVEQTSPSPERPKTKKPSSSQASVKRKATSSGKKRKGK